MNKLCFFGFWLFLALLGFSFQANAQTDFQDNCTVRDTSNFLGQPEPFVGVPVNLTWGSLASAQAVLECLDGWAKSEAAHWEGRQISSGKPMCVNTSCNDLVTEDVHDGKAVDVFSVACMIEQRPGGYSTCWDHGKTHYYSKSFMYDCAETGAWELFTSGDCPRESENRVASQDNICDSISACKFQFIEADNYSCESEDPAVGWWTKYQNMGPQETCNPNEDPYAICGQELSQNQGQGAPAYKSCLCNLDATLPECTGMCIERDEEEFVSRTCSTFTLDLDNPDGPTFACDPEGWSDYTDEGCFNGCEYYRTGENIKFWGVPSDNIQVVERTENFWAYGPTCSDDDELSETQAESELGSELPVDDTDPGTPDGSDGDGNCEPGEQFGSDCTIGDGDGICEPGEEGTADCSGSGGDGGGSGDGYGRAIYEAITDDWGGGDCVGDYCGEGEPAGGPDGAFEDGSFDPSQLDDSGAGVSRECPATSWPALVLMGTQVGGNWGPICDVLAVLGPIILILAKIGAGFIILRM